MNDQPHADQPTDHDHGHDQPSTDQVTTPVWVTMEQAAEQLGITVNAVRQRIKRETLIATKTDDGWFVDMSATDQRPGTKRPPTTATNQPTMRPYRPTSNRPLTLRPWRS